MERVKKICEEVKSAGGRAFLVGGIVRDKFLGLESKDIDLEVFGIEPEALKTIIEKFGKVKECGKSFGVLKLDDLDISLPRRERKTGVGHKGFETECDPHMSIEEACSRRDLTINAMLFDPLTDELLDPFNGLTDIENKVLRHVDDIRFAEDPLRVLRVAQFHARFDFRVHDDTNELCVVLLDELKHLSKERFFIEFEKMLMKANRPSKAFEWMLEFGVLDELFPELAVLDTIEQGRKYHYGRTVFEHTMRALDFVPKKERELDVMLAILCHDTGKSICKAETDGDHISFHGHAEDGEPPTRSFLSKITNDKKITEDVVSLVKYHMRFFDLKKNLKRKLIRRLSLHVNIKKLAWVYKADKHSRTDDYEVESFLEEILNMYDEVQNEIKPLVKGKHLIDIGMKPSPLFGNILRKAFDAQIDGLFNTLEDGIKYVKNMD